MLYNVRTCSYIYNCIYVYMYIRIHINLYPGNDWSPLIFDSHCKVIDSENLEADNALMESGMDSLSGDLAGRSLGA